MFKAILGAVHEVKVDAAGNSVNKHLGPLQFLSPFGPSSLPAENRDTEVKTRDSAEYGATAFLPAGRRAKIELRNNFSPVGR